MAFDLVALGRKLAAARINAGLSQEQAAKSIGVSRSALSLIETGDRATSTLEVVGLASLYRRPVVYFFEDAEADNNMVALGRVSEEYKSKPEFQQTIQWFLDVCQAGASLESKLNRPVRKGPPSYTLGHPQTQAEAAEHGAMIAADERKRLDLGDAAIPDLAELLSCQGIWATSSKLPDEMSGLFLRERQIGFAVIVNDSHCTGRKRFSFAHEYAHALLDRDHEVAVTTKQNSKDLIERRANAFAAAFLMPEAGIRELLDCVRAAEPSRRVFTTYDVANNAAAEAEKRSSSSTDTIAFTHVALIAYHFEVSYQAACYRLKDMNLVNRDELNRLLAEEETLGKPYLELLPKGRSLYATNTSEQKLVEQLIPLIVDALKMEAISEAKAREISKWLKLEDQQIDTVLILGGVAG